MEEGDTPAEEPRPRVAAALVVEPANVEGAGLVWKRGHLRKDLHTKRGKMGFWLKLRLICF